MSITIGGTAYTGSVWCNHALAADALEAVLTAVTAFATSTVADSGAVAVTYDAVPSAEQASLTAQYNTVRESDDCIGGRLRL